MARFHGWCFLLACFVPPVKSSTDAVSVNVIPRTYSIFLSCHLHALRHIGCLHISFRRSKSLFHLSLILLLAGDISINPDPDESGNVKLAFTNIRSLPKNQIPLSHYVDVNHVDMVCLSETWLSGKESQSHINSITPTGFSLYHKPRIGKKGGGVGFLIRDEIRSNVQKSPEYSSFEHLVLHCKFQQRSVNFVSIYRPPGSTKLFFDDFISFLDYLLSLSSDPIIVGDLNIDPSRHATSYKRYSDILSGLNLKQSVNIMTHLQGGILDHFITAAGSDLLSKRICINDCITDHLCMLAHINVSFFINNKPTVTSFRKFNKIDLASLKQDLASCDLITNPCVSSCIDLYDQYHSSLVSLLDKHAPICTKTSRRQSEKWLCAEFFNAKRLKRRLERNWRRTKTPLDRSKFRMQVNKCNSILNQSKSKYYAGLIQENISNPRQLWQSLYSVMHRVRFAPIVSDSSKSLAAKFSWFFENKIDKIRSTFTNPDVPHPSPYTPPLCLSSFSAISEFDLLKIINNSPSKSCSLDPWPTFLVKDCIDILIKPLTRLINMSLREGVFPDQFKFAIITPILKNPSLDKSVLKNYRPVSGLNFVSKLVERVVAIQLKHHLSDNNLENLHQSAYKAGHSTETALLKIKSDIHINLSQNIPTALILLDLSAAFDTIDHARLLERLKSWFGISDVVLNWFTSYLGHRSQSVKVNEAVSSPRPLLYGVPQGSVLGPILFTLYTSPLSSIIAKFKNLKHHFYADDTQIYIAINPANASSAISELQACLLEIRDWMNDNKLKLNPDKTEFIIFGSELVRSKLSHLFPVDFLGNLISPVDKVKNLGVIFDASFNFSAHVSSICSSCYYHIRDFARIRRYLPKSTSILVANALVGSRIDYCNSLLDSISEFDIKRLRSVQYSLCRIINRTSRFSREHMSPHLKALHWLPIRQRIQFKWFVMTYKIVNFGLPPYFNPYFVPFSSSKFTRRSNSDKKFLNRDVVPFDRKVHKCKSHYDSSFYVSGPVRWNRLPDHIRCSPSLSSFRSRLKGYLFRNAYPP